MKESLVMTVSDREPEILLSTLRWLLLSDLSDSEIILVNDNSIIDYSWLKPYFEANKVKWVDMEPYECHKSGPHKNYNNPAKAFNRCLQEAQGENIGIISSDTIVPPRVLQAARKVDTGQAVFCPMVIDLGSSMEYCGPHRIFPMPWFLYTATDNCRRAGGWDENYLLGLCYEDNDFIGRLALTVGKFLFDWSMICWHQSHHQPAYEIDNQWVKIANDRNRVYTMDKWTGMPFGESDLVAFEVTRGMDESGLLAWTFKDIKSVYEKVMRETLSPFPYVKSEEKSA